MKTRHMGTTREMQRHEIARGCVIAGFVADDISGYWEVAKRLSRRVKAKEVEKRKVGPSRTHAAFYRAFKP